MNCPACNAALADGARFCHHCGATVGQPKSGGWRAGLPWGLGGVVVGVILTAIVFTTMRRGPAVATGDDTPAAPFAGGAPGGAAPDISSMSPEERASRLYSRIMSLHAAGKPDSAEFFLPMALQAYAMLSTRGADAHYHIGVLDLTAGDMPGALAQADTIRKLSKTHLFSDMLVARVLVLRQDSTGARRAFQNYLKHEGGELEKHLPEYTEHASAIDAFHQEAIRAISVPPRPAGS